MRNFAKNRISKIKKINLKSILFLIILLPTTILSQEYRSAEAYIADFGKNDMYIKKALMDYSITIVESFLETRSEITAKRIVDKLKIINSNVNHHDKGYKGNTVLRDGFLKMNEKTLEAIEKKTMILDDYETQSELRLDEIISNFSQRETGLFEYFEEINKFEKIKKVFGKQYNLSIRNYDENNIFEYCGKQNILFYKMNVLDHKLIYLIKNKDKNGFTECIKILEKLKTHVLANTAVLKNNFKDQSLNNANIEYMNFLSNQNEKIIPYVYDYMNHYVMLEQIKAKLKKNQQSNATINEQNKYVKLYNFKKKVLLTMLEEIQNSKKILYNNWYATNGKFLKNNIVFENIHEKFIKKNK